MAKKPAVPAGTVPGAPPPAAPAMQAPAAFAITVGSAPPAITRGAFGREGATVNPYTVTMKGMPVPEGGVYAQGWIVADVPATITDPAERLKAGKEEARKLSNRISGIARRLSDEKDADGNYYTYAIRTREENGVWGVRVYRIAPAAPVPPTPRAPAAVAPVAPGTLPPPPPPPPAA